MTRSGTSLAELSFELDGLDAADAEAACIACGAMSVTLSDARDDPVLEPLPGEVRLWPQTRVNALFSAEEDPHTTARALAAALAISPESIAVRLVEDKPWEREWLRDFHAMRFGKRLWVCPHHEQVTEPDAVVVHLDPGLAFGTGTHPTTAMCLEWLDAHLTPGVRLIDYGCGSGILAVAAAKLGAREAWCFDIDPQALAATRENAQANDVADRVLVCETAQQLPHDVDVVMANILSGPLCELAPRIAQLTRAGGEIVLAGLLDYEAGEVTRAYSTWFDMATFGKRDEWVALTGRRRS
mgnify:CR=1 FL=1